MISVTGIRRAAVISAVWAWLTPGVAITDIVQPGEVAAGDKFEVAVRAMVDADSVKTAGGEGSLILAVAVPPGWEISGVIADAGGKTKLAAREGLALPAPAPEGEAWRLFATPKAVKVGAYVGRALEFLLRVQTSRTPGDYYLAYAAGISQGEGVSWGRREDGAAGRWLVVK